MKVGKKVKELIRQQGNISAKVKVDKSWTPEDIGLDSLDQIELIMEVEETFDIEISDCEAAKLHTVGDLIKIVKARVKDE